MKSRTNKTQGLANTRASITNDRPVAKRRIWRVASSRITQRAVRIAALSSLFIVMIMLNLATAMAFIQTHNLSEIRNIDTDFNMSQRAVYNTSYIGVDDATNSANRLDTASNAGTPGTLYWGPYGIWNSGNDGSGSGLDADTLDGTDSSSFLTSESDTLATVTNRGASTSNATSFTNTSNPGLTVGDGATGYLRIGGSTIYDAAGDLTLNSDSGEVYTADDVGIGIANPTQKLEVAGHILVQGLDGFDANGEQGIVYLGDTNNWIYSEFGGPTSIQGFNGINFTTTGSFTEQMIIESGGNVGIGTTSPATSLHVQGGSIIGNSSGSASVQAGAGILGSGSTGVWGYNSGGVNFGELGTAAEGVHGSSSSGSGVKGESTSGSGVYGESSSNYGVVGNSTTNNGVVGVYGGASPTDQNAGVAGFSTDVGVYGNATSVGVEGMGNSGVLGRANYSSYSVGVRGVYSSDIFGYLGGAPNTSFGFYGAYGQFDSNIYGYLGGLSIGAYGRYDSNNFAYLGGSGIGVYGSGTSNAGYFAGNVTVTGNLTVGTGTVFIDGTNSKVGVGTVTPTSQLAVGGDGVANAGIYAEGVTYGVYANGTSSYGVFAVGNWYPGVYGNSSNSYGVEGSAISNVGVLGSSVNSDGVYGSAPNAYGVNGRGLLAGVYGEYWSNSNINGALGDSGYGVIGNNAGNIYGYLAGSSEGVYGQYDSSQYAFLGTSLYGVLAVSSASNAVTGAHGGASITDQNAGVYGSSATDFYAGVYGYNVAGTSARGVEGSGGDGYGGYFSADTAGGYGIYARGASRAGSFSGDVVITGTCTSEGSDCAVDIAERWISESAKGYIYCGDEVEKSSKSGQRCILNESFELEFSDGDVVCIDSSGKGMNVLKSCDGEFDRGVLSVVSYNATTIFGPEAYPYPVALAGNVPVNVICDTPINKGDLLVTSSEAGYAMKLDTDDPNITWKQSIGTIFAKALSGCDGSNRYTQIRGWLNA